MQSCSQDPKTTSIQGPPSRPGPGKHPPFSIAASDGLHHVSGRALSIPVPYTVYPILPFVVDECDYCVDEAQVGCDPEKGPIVVPLIEQERVQEAEEQDQLRTL